MIYKGVDCMARRKTHKEFLLELKTINKNIKLLGKYVHSKQKIKCKCMIDGYIWEAYPTHLLRGHGCPKCAGNIKKTHKEFVKELNSINENIEIMSRYKNDGVKVLCRCKIDNHEWEATPNNLLRGYGCPKCGELRRINLRTKKHSEFIKELKLVNPNIEVLSEYSRSDKKIKCRCKIDSHEWEALPSSLLYGQGCPECGISRSAKARTKTHDVFIKELNKVNPNIEAMEEYKKNNIKMKFRCKLDGNVWETLPVSLLVGIGCPSCNSSKGEKEVEKYLKENLIPYKKQYTFNGCKYKKELPFDFYLPTLNIAIEYDGIQHFKPVEVFGGKEAYKLQVKKDKIKNDYCKSKGIKLIRIPYTTNNIKKLLDEELKQLNVLAQDIQ